MLNLQSPQSKPMHGIRGMVACESLPDDQLVDWAKKGLSEAFGELHRRYERRMFCTAMKITRSSEDSEDAVQDSFLKAFRNLEGFAGRSSFSTWLTRILINTCLMQYRKKRSCILLSLDEPRDSGESWKETLADELISVETAYTQKQQSEVLSKAISALNPKLRVMIESYQLRDCSIAELAECNQISVGAAKSRMLRARSALRSSYRLRKACGQAPFNRPASSS